MAEGTGRARRMWASASSAPRRRGRHLLLGLASPLLPCSRWPPPPSPTTRRAGSGGGDVQELRSSRGHFLRKLLLDGRRFPKNASRSTAISLVNLWNQCHPLNHHHQMKASFGSN